MALTVKQAKVLMLEEFISAWNTILPDWDHETQTSTPPDQFSEPSDGSPWIKVICGFYGGQNRSIPIRDEVNGLFTVDCYAKLDGLDGSTLFAEQDLADYAHEALRSSATTKDIHHLSIEQRDFPLTGTGYQHTRMSLFFRFDRPRVE